MEFRARFGSCRIYLLSITCPRLEIVVLTRDAEPWTSDTSPDTPIVLGQLRLTNFINPQGLQAIGGNRFVETSASGVPLTNIPGTSGLGTLAQGSIEQSNVDTSTELVRMVTTSRDYVANSRALKVEDQLIEGALGLVV